MRLTGVMKSVTISMIVSLWCIGLGAEEKTVELTLDDCIDRALQENLNFRISSLGLKTDELSILQAESIFDPSISLDMNRGHSETPTFFQYYGVGSIESESTEMNLTLGQRLSTGANWGVGFYNTLSESNIETAKNYTSTFGISLSQPLLKGFGRKVNRANIYLARLTRETTKYDIEDRAIGLVYEVQRAYWDLVYAWQTLRVRELSVQQADSLLAYNKKAMQLGVLTESDVLEAESMLLSRKQEVLDQQSRIRSAEDLLRRLLNMTSEADWQLRLYPTDEPGIREVDIDLDTALEKALAVRPDYKIAKKRLEQNEFNRDMAKNSTLPDLDLSARYNVHGSGKNYSKDIRDMGDFEQYGWNVGIVLSYPLKNRNAKAEYEKREVMIKRSNLELRNLENDINTEIRSAARNARILRESVDVAKKNVEVDERKLMKEEERFRNQLSSSYYVLQFQRDLANARNLYNRAVIDYMMALNELARAQGTVLSDLNVSIISLEN